MLDDLQRLDRLRIVFGNTESYGPVDEGSVDRAESELGVRFPSSYRLFLRHYGAAWLAYEVAGLPSTRASGAEPPLFSHVLDWFDLSQRSSNGAIPRSFVPFSSDGGDYTFYLDTEVTAADGESPVVVLGPGFDGDVVAGSFLEFAERVAQGETLP